MNVGSVVSRAARMYGQYAAIECDGKTMTFADVNGNANRVANALRARGYAAGTRIAMMLRNQIEFPEVDFGIAKAGLVSVQINPMLGSSDVRAILEDSQAALLVFDLSLCEVIEACGSTSSDMAFVAIGGGDRPEWASDYLALLAAASPDEPPPVLQPNALYRLAYTSGTTGQPKGVMLTHSAVLAVAYNLLLEFGPVFRGHRLLHLQPLCHGTGMFVLPWFMRGGTSVVHPRFDAERVIESRRLERVDCIKLVPTMLVRMLELGEGRLSELRGVGTIIYGASPMPVDRLRQGIDVLGPIFAQLYGQSESPMTITVLPKEDHVVRGSEDIKRLASAGRPWTNVDVRVLTEDGQDAPTDAEGEVVVWGPQNMVGYWNRPAETAKTLVDGWVHTRDIGTFDERGYLYVLDRKDDMIITGGLNVYPRQVEDVLYQHGSVSEAVVVGVPDSRWGERVVAVVSLRSSEKVTTAALIQHCRDRLSRYRVPKDVVFVERIPKTAFGKISRKQVKQELLKRDAAV
jgi:long-chain acyl-CoA synthetase